MKRRQARKRRDTTEDIAKIMYLEEESMRLDHQTKMLCHIIKQLRTLFWLTSGPKPTIMARNLLGRNKIVAEMRENLLLVWGCNTVDTWHPILSSLCYEHMPVLYRITEVPDAERTGYLDITTQEIMRSSSVAPCRTHYLGDINGTFPHLRQSPSSGNTSFNPPSWERETTEAANHISSTQHINTMINERT